MHYTHHPTPSTVRAFATEAERAAYIRLVACQDGVTVRAITEAEAGAIMYGLGRVVVLRDRGVGACPRFGRAGYAEPVGRAG
jgi:hypothetical protein